LTNLLFEHLDYYLQGFRNLIKIRQVPALLDLHNLDGCINTYSLRVGRSICASKRDVDVTLRNIDRQFSAFQDRFDDGSSHTDDTGRRGNNRVCLPSENSPNRPLE